MKKKNTEHIINYDIYIFSRMEKIFLAIVIAGFAAVFSFIFYNNIISFFIFLIPGPVYIKYFRKKFILRRKEKLLEQFREFLVSLSAQLSSGYSMEYGLLEVLPEMRQMYGMDGYICKEIMIMLNRLSLNIKIEDTLKDFGNRSGIYEIKLFSEVISVSKRTGGDMINIIKKTSETISRKFEVNREIKEIINAKKYEYMVMCCMPEVIVLYMRFTAGDLMGALYNSLMGRVVVTICLIIYFFAVIIGLKMTEIKY